jgi:hypothetical protein
VPGVLAVIVSDADWRAVVLGILGECPASVLPAARRLTVVL